VAVDAPARAAFVERLRAQDPVFFPFGGLTASARLGTGGAVIYQIQGSGFPLQPSPIAVIEDLPPDSADAFGTLGRSWFGNGSGLKSVNRSQLDADGQAQLARAVEALRHDAVWAQNGQALDLDADTSRDHFEKKARFVRAFKRGMTSRQDLTQGFEELAAKWSPQDGDTALSLKTVLAPPPASLVAAPASLAGAPVSLTAAPASVAAAPASLATAPAPLATAPAPTAH
jgi:hypothetical protein